jgi:rare lipoprotein A
LRKLAPAGAIALAAVLLAGCGSKGQHSAVRKTKEYFSESEYGVKASPRVALGHSNLKRGGGREQIGKPYMVRGQWYHPKEVASYSRVGKASWYGDAFHGRLTANGEIYDMTHLTAAHPTLPLPSYARVTNLENGSSVIVRVNDRGPFAHGRIIDLSKRAAQLLDYTRTGVAEVRVDYIGRAPLHGQDDQYLIASYRPGGAGPDPSDGLPSGVLVAMNGPTPARDAVRPPAMISDGPVGRLPDLGPVLVDRPAVPGAIALERGKGLVSAFAGEGAGPAGAALERLASGRLTPEAVIGSWKRQRGPVEARQTVFIGTFDGREAADETVAALSDYGPATIERTELSGRTVHVLTMNPEAGAEQQLLARAWAIGAGDAFLIHD